MNNKEIYIGAQPLRKEKKEVKGEFVERDGTSYYKISSYDAMRPFFMTIVSAYDHWLFVASNGGLTAGRINPESALFPYSTDDKIIDTANITGSKTIFHIRLRNSDFLWEPFSDYQAGAYRIKRNLYKSKSGHELIFEEVNIDLEVCFSYALSSSQKFGFTKKSELKNIGLAQIEVNVLDGIQNILPYGVERALQSNSSTLIDAYKKNELHEETGLGIFTLSSMVVDRAEPSEALKATTVWSSGLDAKATLLSSLQIADFRIGNEIKSESEVKAEKGSYFVQSEFTLAKNKTKRWYTTADVNQNVNMVEQSIHTLKTTQNLGDIIDQDIRKGQIDLIKKVGCADGIQMTQDSLSNCIHFSNVMYNIMRGGTFEDQYTIDKEDFTKHLKHFNAPVYKNLKEQFNSLSDEFTLDDLNTVAKKTKDPDFERLCAEYLPLSFSRRHGDPSRPWNHFSINVQDEDGNRIRNYEGNWRDVFQNWEALARSFPEFIEGMITKFVNASTSDGYNPYRISTHGIDWEVIEPDNPWSYIGYWGDHQIIYLLKLLELSADHHPNKLNELLQKDINVYANVPYVIKGYDAIILNSKETVEYNEALSHKIENRVKEIGADGKLSVTSEEQLIRANLTEKLLVTSLTKLYNFVPDGGIWMNTQRPEWNDANNALVGNGVSMVTLNYLNRFLKFGIDLFGKLGDVEISINKPVSDLLDALHRGLKVRTHLLETGFDDVERRKLMDRFGIAGEHYRHSAYAGFYGARVKVNAQEIVAFFKLAKQFLTQTIEGNQREDGLYHSYNLISFGTETAHVEHLYEMLEGQVAVMSAKHLDAEESLRVLDALKSSDMFRADQYSYMLYPDRTLKPFLEKNLLPKDKVEASKLLMAMVEKNNKAVVLRDLKGEYHFNGNFHNANDVINALDGLKKGEFADLANSDRQAVLDLFEEQFDHKAFTGRSGTFYGYEGLGSIYWHMVSKLLLATQETIIAAQAAHADGQVIGKLVDHYYEIRAGIGINKSPELYGAFPTDAYSHTPKNNGVQQPGMTGQVKEDILSRWGELGVLINMGQISFNPTMMNAKEYLNDKSTFTYFDVSGTQQSMELPTNSLGFTYCQVPIVYYAHNQITDSILHYKNGTSEIIHNNTLSEEQSANIFKRTGKIEKVEVRV
jgi:hypothetical protein